jgi:formiminotetrahydrofolate cyclodeaminase
LAARTAPLGDGGVTDAPESFAELAGELARASPPAGAGVVAAGVASVAAGLAESIARASLSSWTEATGVAVQALVLRRRADAAGRANAEAYTTARRWLDQRAEPRAPGRDAMLRAALYAAADALLVITAAAADCATLAAEIAGHCTPELEADASAAGELAATAARAAGSLIEINLALAPLDPRRVRARSLVQTAESESRRARERPDSR